MDFVPANSNDVSREESPASPKPVDLLLMEVREMGSDPAAGTSLQDVLHDMEQKMQQEEEVEEEDRCADDKVPPPHSSSPPAPNFVTTSSPTASSRSYSAQQASKPTQEEEEKVKETVEELKEKNEEQDETAAVPEVIRGNELNISMPSNHSSRRNSQEQSPRMGEENVVEGAASNNILPETITKEEEEEKKLEEEEEKVNPSAEGENKAAESPKNDNDKISSNVIGSNKNSPKGSSSRDIAAAAPPPPVTTSILEKRDTNPQQEKKTSLPSSSAGAAAAAEVTIKEPPQQRAFTGFNSTTPATNSKNRSANNTAAGSTRRGPLPSVNHITPVTDEDLQELAEELLDRGEVPTEFQRLPKGKYTHTQKKNDNDNNNMNLTIPEETVEINNNSHVNRMDKGSYSRFLISQDYVDPETTEREETFRGERNFCGTVPLNVDYKQATHDKMKMTQDELATLEGGWSASSRGLPHRKRYSIHDADGTVSLRLTRTQDDLHGWGSSSKGPSPFLLTGNSIGVPTAEGGEAPQVIGSHPRHPFGASTMKREAELLDDELYEELCRQRERRKRLPDHCKPVRQQRDFVYYNSKSKGFYVPQDLPPSTTMLNYNHLYDFGDGTRMGAANNHSTKLVRESDPAGPKANSTYKEPPLFGQSRRNPTAQAPLKYAETTRGAAAYQETYWAKTHHGNTYKDNYNASGNPAEVARHQKTRQDIENQSSSLATARALRVQDVHVSQTHHMRKIEDVVAENPNYLKSDAGEVSRSAKKKGKNSSTDHLANGSGENNNNNNNSNTGGGLYNACTEGKLKWEEVPPQLQEAVEQALDKKEERELFTQSQKNATYNSNNNNKNYSSSLPGISSSRNAGGSANAKKNTTAATTNNNNSSNGKTGGSGGSSSREAPYKVSRLRYKKEYTQESNPSAFVK